MRYVRLQGPDGVLVGAIRGSRVVTRDGTEIELLDPEAVVVPAPYEVLLPVEPPEVWCAGVTYERSRDARVEESSVKDVYTLVYDAPRPELFLKDAALRRTVGPGKPIAVRADSHWNVPEPEIGIVIGRGGRPEGLTIGNDVSSRDIEGAMTLSCRRGACVRGTERRRSPRDPGGGGAEDAEGTPGAGVRG